jgi:hypothetical protein
MSPNKFAAAAARVAAGVALVAAVLGASPAAAILGGSEDPSGLAASTAMVLSSRGGMCSGIVLAPEAVLTAAHCVAGADIRVHWREAGEPVLVVPASVAVHPGYDPAAIRTRRRSTDLALVRLAAPLPARFVPAALAGAAPGAGTALLVGGYGVAREGDPRSTGTFRTAALAAIEPYGPSRILVWMAAPGGAARGPCTGDSGGPAAGPDGAVVAVVTWSSGPGRAACGGRSQGVLVGPERGWIDRTLAGWSARAAWR